MRQAGNGQWNLFHRMDKLDPATMQGDALGLVLTPISFITKDGASHISQLGPDLVPPPGDQFYTQQLIFIADRQNRVFQDGFLILVAALPLAYRHFIFLPFSGKKMNECSFHWHFIFLRNGKIKLPYFLLTQQFVEAFLSFGSFGQDQDPGDRLVEPVKNSDKCFSRFFITFAYIFLQPGDDSILLRRFCLNGNARRLRDRDIVVIFVQYMGSPFHDQKREGREISIAFSPCPNDTFMMDALVNGKLPTSLDFKVHLMDIQQLNQSAMSGEYDVTKISVAAYPLVSDHYDLLDAGAAMGFGCGPLVVARTPHLADDLGHLKIAIPGRHTTANYLFHHFFPEASNTFFTVFSEIEGLVVSGEAGAGVIIHESRFTYRQKGLFCIADLGALWEEKFHLPLPLGVLVCRKSLPLSDKETINDLIRTSIRYAFDHPEASADYVLNHAREMDPEVVKKHIALYVNDYSLSMGPAGREAIDFLIHNENLIQK